MGWVVPVLVEVRLVTYRHDVMQAAVEVLLVTYRRGRGPSTVPTLSEQLGERENESTANRVRNDGAYLSYLSLSLSL